MFQNINEATIENEKKEIPRKWIQVINKNNIVIYLVTFMLSLVGVGGEFSLFSISMLGACFASAVPLLGIVVVSTIANIIKFGLGGALEYFLTALVLVATIFIINLNIMKKKETKK